MIRIEDKHPGRRSAIAVFFAMLALGAARGAAGQAIDPYYLQVNGASANTLEITAGYDHADHFQYDNFKPNIKNTYLDQYSTDVRFEHDFHVLGYRAAVQVFQGVVETQNWRFGGGDLNHASGIRKLGLTNTTFSAVIWPYVDQADQASVYTAFYLTPPDGSFSKSSSVNPSYNGWGGDAQIGLRKGFGPRLSTSAAFDTEIRGDEGLSNDRVLSVAPIYRLQAWGNWNWTGDLATSLGYVGVFGGKNRIAETLTVIQPVSDDDIVVVGAPKRGAPGILTTSRVSFADGRDDALQRIRAQATYRLNPRAQAGIEVAHDMAATGGYGLGIGATARLKLWF